MIITARPFFAAACSPARPAIVGVPVVGKADVPDLAALLFLPDPVQDAHLLQLLPHGHVRQVVHQVVVDVVRAQTAQLLAEIAVQSRPVPDQVLGQLGGQVHLLPDAVSLEDLAHGGLAAGIDVGGVKVVDPGAVGGQQLPLRLLDIHAGALSGKAHAAVAKNAQFVAFSVLPVLHHYPPPRQSRRCFLLTFSIYWPGSPVKSFSASEGAAAGRKRG